jgi:hypothetical protein
MKKLFVLSVLMLALSLVAMQENDVQEAPAPLMMTETGKNAVKAIGRGKYGVGCCLICAIPCCCLCDTGLALYEQSKPFIKKATYVADQLGIVTKKRQ